MPRSSHLLHLVAVVAALLCAGCYQKTLRDDWGTFKELSQQHSSKSDRSDPDSIENQGYSIQVASFEGNSAPEDARRLADKLKDQYNLIDLWVRDADHESDVMRGRYTSPNVEDAQRDLEQIQQITINNSHPYSGADIISLGLAQAADLATFDLAQHSGKYSLQIAFYDAESGAEYRKLAEQEARNLRKKGVEAYFYHGDNMSLVTVGVFEDSDFVQMGNSFAYGDNVKLLQAKFPYNMGNGHLIPEKKDDVIVGNQPSFLVKVN